MTEITSRRNIWTDLLKENYNLISEEYKHIADRFIGIKYSVYKIENYENYFSFDGWSSEPYAKIIEDFKSNRDQLKIPEYIKFNESSLFFNLGEGYCTDEIFFTIHSLIEICRLTGPCFYQNCSVNLKEMYKKYCEKNNMPMILQDCFYKNVAFDNPNNPFYKYPSVQVLEVEFDQKKLFCSFNWNPWQHRLALITLFNYYDLIDYGHITSPGARKYIYNKDDDWKQLIDTSQIWFRDHKDVENILDKLLELKDKFPLVIDDRSQYNDTDIAITDTILKAPLFEARVNSLFEVTAETRFTGEHFFSEKTFWPIHLGKPFLMVNGANSLAALRSLGYKTFSPYIDESYDLETDGSARVEMVVLELVKLKNLRQNDPAKFLEVYDVMMEISNYNKSFFRRKQ